jgi:hypothetical protein
VADGHSLHSQKHVIHISKFGKKRHLFQAAHINDDSTLSLYVHKHLGDSGRNETDVSQGWVGEE